MQAVKGSKVTLKCRVTDRQQGTLLDDGGKPMTFVVGAGQVVAGLEMAIEGKAAGFQSRFTLEPEEAYGLYRPELVFEAVRENLPSDLDIQPGMYLTPGGSEGRFQLKVLSLTELGAMLDGNHHLAGKRLDFEVEVIDVQISGAH